MNFECSLLHCGQKVNSFNMLPMELQLVMVTCPPGETGENIAKTLVEERLAACVNILPSVVSVFFWEGKVAREDESLLLVKVRSDMLKRLEARIYELHPYDIPEFVVIEPKDIGEKYLRWALG